jgi:hypothetical protein
LGSDELRHCFLETKNQQFELLCSPCSPWTGGRATTPTDRAAIHGGHRVDPRLEVQEEPLLSPAQAPPRLQCHAPSASTMSDVGSPRAASPRSTNRDNVSDSATSTNEFYFVAIKSCIFPTSVALTLSSPGVVHYAHSSNRRWLVSTISATTWRPCVEQKASHNHDIC